MIEYEMILSLDISKLLPDDGNPVAMVNDLLATYGCSERMGIRSKAISISVKSDRELKDEEIEKLKTITLQTAKENALLGKCNVEFESFRRKSGNAEQSVLQ